MYLREGKIAGRYESYENVLLQRTSYPTHGANWKFWLGRNQIKIKIPESVRKREVLGVWVLSQSLREAGMITSSNRTIETCATFTQDMPDVSSLINEAWLPNV